jgi:predicted DNA binding CopG/RHH family protein
MRREYDFSKGRRNPYAGRLKQSVTIRLDSAAVRYFKGLAAELEIPYQTLINFYLRDCAASHRKLDLQWKPTRKRRSPTRG